MIPIRLRSWLLVICSLALFSDTFLYSVAVPVLPSYLRRLGYEHLDGVLFACYAMGICLAVPIMVYVNSGGQEDDEDKEENMCSKTDYGACMNDNLEDAETQTQVIGNDNYGGIIDTNRKGSRRSKTKAENLVPFFEQNETNECKSCEPWLDKSLTVSDIDLHDEEIQSICTVSINAHSETVESPSSGVSILSIQSIAAGDTSKKKLNFALRRAPMLGSLIVLVGATICFGFADSVLLLFFARTLQGIASAGTWVMSLTLIADLFPPDQRGEKFGLAMSSTLLGMLLGPVVAGPLYQRVGYSSVFYACGGFVALDALLRFLFVKDEDIQALHEEMLQSYTLLGSGEQNEKTLAHSKNLVHFSSLLTNRSILILCFAQFSVNLCLTGLEPIWTDYVTQTFDLTIEVSSYLFIVMMFPIIISTILFGILTDIPGIKFKLLGWGMVGTCCVFPLLAIFTGRDHLIFFLIIVVLVAVTVSSPLAPILPLMTAFISQKNSRSFIAVCTIFNLSFAFGAVAGPISAAFCFQHYGFLWTCILLILPMVISIPLLSFADPEPQFEMKSTTVY